MAKHDKRLQIMMEKGDSQSKFTKRNIKDFLKPNVGLRRSITGRNPHTSLGYVTHQQEAIPLKLTKFLPRSKISPERFQELI